MIADILYPIFTLKITVLAYLIQKNRGPEHHHGRPGGLTAPPIPPAAEKMMRPYSLWIIP